jgi:hypothetical protein
MSIKRKVIDHLKNIPGWRTNRKIVVFSVDDYGNVRLDSKESLRKLDEAGLKPKSIFDLYDALETQDDLSNLFEVLTSVRDANKNPACFTAFSLVANIDFEKVIENGYQSFQYEFLPETYKKLGREKILDIIADGIHNKIFIPQFHGREHVNVKIFNDLLTKKNKSLLANINNRSFSRIEEDNLSKLPYSVSFFFKKWNENESLKPIISEGLEYFHRIFGYRATNFMPPSATASSELNFTLSKGGVKFLDSAMFRNEKMKSGKDQFSFVFTGKENEFGQKYLVRNVVFEPCFEKNSEAVDIALSQIQSAFNCRKPAVISSHRVNFCGRISEGNRKKGLDDLRNLLQNIIRKWPEVEFLSADQLCSLMDN